MSDELETAANTQVDTVQEWRRPRLVSLLFCDSCNYREDGKTDVIGIFDRIYVHPDRRQTPPFTLFVRTTETAEGMMLATCRAPNGLTPTMVSFARVPKEAYTPNLPSNFQSIVHMNPFYVAIEGVYWFEVFFEGNPLGGAGLVIEFRETEDKTGGTDTYV